MAGGWGSALLLRTGDSEPCGAGTAQGWGCPGTTMPALCSWYFSGISRTEARQLLLSPANAPGAFLIRPSESSQGDYSLSGTRVAPGDPVPRRRPAQPNQPGTLLTAGRLRPRQCQPLAHAGPHVGPAARCPLPAASVRSALRARRLRSLTYPLVHSPARLSAPASVPHPLTVLLLLTPSQPRSLAKCPSVPAPL